MNIKEIKGDALSFKNWDFIGHCANCCNVMGSGIAYSIQAMFPAAYEADTAAARNKTNILGNISYASVGIGQNIVNLYGQQTPGSARQVNYEAIYAALEKTRALCDKSAKKGIAFPYKMASDRAGGDWRIIAAMIEVVFESAKYPVFIVKL